MDPRTDAGFPNTRWSLVAETKGDAAVRERALEELCSLYWKPVYAFLRRRGLEKADAEDAAQGFFSSLLKEDGFAKADAEVGRMRTFLLAALRRWRRDDWRKSSALKRGGGREMVSFEGAEEEGWQIESALDSPEKEFDRRCAAAVLEAALQRLQEEQAAAGKGKAFDVLRPLLSPTGSDMTQEMAAETLGLSREALRVSLHRLRKRFGELLRKVVADTLTHPSEEAVAEEMAALQSAMAG